MSNGDGRFERTGEPSENTGDPVDNGVGGYFGTGIVDDYDVGGGDGDKPKEQEYARPPTSTGEPWGAAAWGIDQEPWSINGSDPFSEAYGYVDQPGVANAPGIYGYPEGPRQPQYSANSAANILRGMSSAELEALERQFYRAGYMDEDTRYTTTGRALLIGTFTNVIHQADTNRVSWEQQIQYDITAYEAWKEEHPEEEEKYHPFEAPDYLKPDYATLSQAAKATTAERLGRKPTSSEMKILTGFMNDADRQQWEQNVYAPELGAYNKGARAFETGEDQGSETYQGYDAAARFGEYFDERYENELQHRENVEKVKTKSDGLFASIDKISRMT